jgi:hypothetical protein
MLNRSKKRIGSEKPGKQSGNILYKSISILLLVVSFICVSTLIITMWVFIQDVYITNKYFRDVYANIVNHGQYIEPEQINQIQAIENAYKSARTFDVMSFFYMFISTILISLVVYYYNKMNQVIRSNKDIIKELKQRTKGSIVRIRKGVKDHKGIIALSEIYNATIEASFILNIIESMSMLDSENANMRINDYMPRLRNKLSKSARLLNEIIMETDRKINLPSKQLDLIEDLFFGFSEKIKSLAGIHNEIIKKNTIDEFSQYIMNCIESLDKLKKKVRILNQR